MSFSSPSQACSQQISPQSNCARQKEPTKHKKIIKDKKKRNSKRCVLHESQVKDIQDFVMQYGKNYFSKSLDEQLNRLKTQYRTALHIKSILGQDQNPYNIKNQEKCKKQAKQYLDLLNILEHAKFKRIQIKKLNFRLAINFYHSKKKVVGCKKHNFYFLHKNQSILYRKSRYIHKEIDDFLRKMTNSSKQNHGIDKIANEILTLCRLNAIFQKIINDTLISLYLSKPQEDSLRNIHIEGPQADHSVNNEYISQLIKKNLSKSFDQTPIDFLNYFKIAENNQKNIHDDIPLKRIANAEQLKIYLKSKKPRLGRHNQNSLATCCSGCFSNHYEIYNPIETCGECGMRVHRLCQKIKGKCQRCKYIRKNTDEKSQSRCCYICKNGNTKGLLIQQFFIDGKQEYAHVFCLLAHQKWKIDNEALVQDMKQTSNINQLCKFCQKESFFTLKCTNCKNNAHGMCAYISGSSFQINSKGNVSFSCCNESKQQERLSFQRKFKMNYERMLNRKGPEFQNFIQSL